MHKPDGPSHHAIQCAALPARRAASSSPSGPKLHSSQSTGIRATPVNQNALADSSSCDVSPSTRMQPQFCSSKFHTEFFAPQAFCPAMNGPKPEGPSFLASQPERSGIHEQFCQCSIRSQPLTYANKDTPAPCTTMRSECYIKHAPDQAVDALKRPYPCGHNHQAALEVLPRGSGIRATPDDHNALAQWELAQSQRESGRLKVTDWPDHQGHQRVSFRAPGIRATPGNHNALSSEVSCTVSPAAIAQFHHVTSECFPKHGRSKAMNNGHNRADKSYQVGRGLSQPFARSSKYVPDAIGRSAILPQHQISQPVGIDTQVHQHAEGAADLHQAPLVSMAAAILYPEIRDRPQ